MATKKAQSFDIDIPGLSITDRGAPESGFILVVEGLEGTGKSRLAMQGPSPSAYFSLNIGSDRVIDEARDEGKTIFHGSFEYDMPKFIVKKGHDWWEEKGKKVMEKHYEPFLKSWRAAYENDDIRTMVQDRCDEFWEMAQLANFGKMQQNQQMMYGPVTSEFIDPIKRAKRAGKLVILIHEIKQAYDRVTEYDSNGNAKEKSVEMKGKYRRGGNRHMGALADSIIRLHYVPGETKIEYDEKKRKVEVEYEARFETEIVMNKPDMSINRQRFETPDLVTLMTMLKPKVDASVWED